MHWCYVFFKSCEKTPILINALESLPSCKILNIYVKTFIHYKIMYIYIII